MALEPANKLTAAERGELLNVLNCTRFVDQAPLQIYATLLEEGRYLGSVSTMYRVLKENALVKDRPGTRPGRSRSWWPPPPDRSTAGTSRSWPDQ